jgi:hypothetical protein
MKDQNKNYQLQVSFAKKHYYKIFYYLSKREGCADICPPGLFTGDQLVVLQR